MSTFTSSSPSESRIASLDALDALIAEIAHLQDAVVHELLDRRGHLCRELARIDEELAELAEEPKAKKKMRASPPAASARKIVLAELLVELEAAPGRTLNLRKANLDVKSTKALAKDHPHLLQLGGKSGWPTVMLMKPADPAASSSRPQGVFAFGEASSAPDGGEAR